VAPSLPVSAREFRNAVCDVFSFLWDYEPIIRSALISHGLHNVLLFLLFVFGKLLQCLSHTQMEKEFQSARQDILQALFELRLSSKRFLKLEVQCTSLFLSLSLSLSTMY
jgi:hypothetical protein